MTPTRIAIAVFVVVSIVVGVYFFSQESPSNVAEEAKEPLASASAAQDTTNIKGLDGLDTSKVTT